MKHRSRIIKIGMPDTLIDTDGTFFFDMRDEYMELMQLQAQLGVPTLYQCKSVVRMRTFNGERYGELSDDDYASIARTLDEYVGRSSSVTRASHESVKSCQ